MRLAFTRTRRNRVDRYTVRRVDTDSDPITAEFNDARHYNRAATALDVDLAYLRGEIRRFMEGDSPLGRECVYEGEPPENLRPVPEVAERTPALNMRVRGRMRPDSTAIPVADFRAALELNPVPSDPQIVWDGTDQFAVLDIDYTVRPADHELTAAVRRLEPQPLAWWASHGRGVHLFYVASGDFSAAEFAAVAAIGWRSLQTRAKFEILPYTRHPAHPDNRGRRAGPVEFGSPTTDVSRLRTLFARTEVEPEEIEEYLTARGLVIGERYPHDRCPVEPHEPGNRNPVCVRDTGIYCYVCAGRGVSRGHRAAGWFPYTVLCGQTVSNVLKRCLENFAHWDHARYVVEETAGLTGEIARRAYSAALKLTHGNDPRVPLAFTAGRDLLRIGTCWWTGKSERYSRDIDPILESLPACQVPGGDGLIVDREKRARLDQSIDLTDYGYPSLYPIFGVRVYSQFLPLRNASVIPILTQVNGLQAESLAPFRPRYRAPEAREFDEESAWAKIEAVFPLLNRPLVKLLIAAKGVVEGESATPPLIYVTGPSMSGKTTTIEIAAAICGEAPTSVPWVNNTERLRQAIYDAKGRTVFVAFNEIVKEATQSKKSARAAMDFILNLTPDSVSHALYVGPVQLGSVPVIIWTDTEIPESVTTDYQIARRIVEARLTRKVPEWAKNAKDHGIGRAQYLRHGNPELASACDTILSVVIDEFFTEHRGFFEIAEALGFTPLTKNEAATDVSENLRDLFRLVCESPAVPTGSYARLWRGRGWKVIAAEDQDELAVCWKSLCGDDFADARRCSEQEWRSLLGIDRDIEFQLRKHGGKIAIRFVSWVNKPAGEYLVNGELCNESRPTDLPETSGIPARGVAGEDQPSDHGQAEGSDLRKLGNDEDARQD